MRRSIKVDPHNVGTQTNNDWRNERRKKVSILFRCKRTHESIQRLSYKCVFYDRDTLLHVLRLTTFIIIIYNKINFEPKTKNPYRNAFPHDDNEMILLLFLVDCEPRPLGGEGIVHIPFATNIICSTLFMCIVY